MTQREQKTLRTAILTICDPGANWEYGWNLICELAGVEAAKCRPPFKQRDVEDIIRLALNPSPPSLDPRQPPQPGSAR